jgi:hypothetical protein
LKVPSNQAFCNGLPSAFEQFIRHPTGQGMGAMEILAFTSVGCRLIERGSALWVS